MPDGVLDRLPRERILELGGKDRNAVQEENHVETLGAFLAVAKLADHGEEVRRVQPPERFVEPARRPEVSQLEFAARILEAVAKDVERPAPLDFPGKALEELLLHGRAVVLFEPFPFLGLGGEDEVDDVAREEAERRVIFFGRPLAISSRRGFAVRRRLFSDAARLPGAGVRPIPEQPALDRFFEAPLRDFHRFPPFSSTALRRAKQNQRLSLH